jgi:hypothetical protein
MSSTLGVVTRKRRVTDGLGTSPTRPRTPLRIRPPRTPRPRILPGPASPLRRPPHRSVSPRRPRWLSPLGAGSPRHTGLASATTVVAVRVGDPVPPAGAGWSRSATAETPHGRRSSAAAPSLTAGLSGRSMAPGSPAGTGPVCPPGRRRPATPVGSSRSLSCWSWPLSWPPESWLNCSGDGT